MSLPPIPDHVLNAFPRQGNHLAWLQANGVMPKYAVPEGAEPIRMSLLDDGTHPALVDADLRGTYVYGVSSVRYVLQKPSLRHVADGMLFGVPVVPDLHARVADKVAEGLLDMDWWHTECGTKHCLAGWAVVLAGERGRELEKDIDTGPAGVLIYYASTGFIPDVAQDTAGAAREALARAGRSA